MSQAMRRFVAAASRKRTVNDEEVDRIPGTTKIRTFCANSSLYSKEGSIENIIKSVRFCSKNSPKNP